ncbi:cholesterol transporter ABCA5-like isoform X4 [Rhineura floridana]|uniref:cholesterol transporter ABCA5-like isoform X4 n=1 Tax=Rhineura floridana TaxID=261503 RepID=UPI002AC81C62|nr:cholesterol transporter ABCA5-like isoform X4 [Rhineura floridana]
MSMDAPEQVGVWRQTRALLYKNCLVKWRTKKASVQEVLIPLTFLGLLIIISMMQPNKRHDEVSDSNLYSANRSSISEFIIGYVPVTNMTRAIMHKVSSEYCTEGKDAREFQSEQEMEEASLQNQKNFVGVIFSDSMSYHLRFPPAVVPESSIHVESRTSCSSSFKMCEAATYWRSGFAALQICIDAAIIELKTNNSVLEELESTKAIMMGRSAVVEIDNFFRAVILIYLVIAFSPFGYFLTIHIMTEKEKKLKEFLMVMGLQDTAFWLSWVLLYTSLIFVMSLLMSVIATFSSLFPKSSSFVIFLLFFLYGISSVSFAFMLTSLFKKANYAGSAQFFTTVAFGAVGLSIVLLEDFPKSFVWSLSPLCECPFLIGVAQVMHLEDYEEGAVFSHLTHGPYPLIIAFILLTLDSMLYLLLGVYFDQVIPGEYGLRRSFVFFLKPSFWVKRTKNYKELYESSINGSLEFNEIVEPVSSEFQGKEAIRINHVQKSYVKKGETVEALKSLSFDIHEGQITALLGHSGTGKTTLMNILCGLCPPSDGFASIYGYRVSEIDEMLDIRKIIGVCQQSDIYFDVLTVRENLSILASVKGIPSNDVIQEVQKVLLDLDMQPIKDNQAKKLSGGQKRKLSIGFAVLGDPKVLLLDEPTAGMDPCSRQTVWNLLKNGKANRVTVFSTHFMEEADIIADRKAVISQGMLKCLGSSLFLKSKWGIGYRLSMQIDRYCNTEGTAFLIKQHIPGASLLKQNEEQLVYALPFNDMDKFSALFADLDTHSHLGVISYGVSMTTLEDVFLRLEVEAEINQADFSAFNLEQAENEMDAKSIDELEQSLLMLSETKSCAVAQKLGRNMERNTERLLVSAVAPYLQCVIWLFLLRYLEMKCGGKSMRKDPFFRTSVKLKPRKFPDVSQDEDEDEDVLAERLRVKEMTTYQNSEEKPAILISNLHKDYDEKTDFLLGRKIKKVATDQVSLCVKKGEVMGLLGPNGAGKSTLINILVGEVEPTSGQVLMGDYSLGENNKDNSMKFMGYCPQTNPLWPDITLQEHFEIYGAIKGMSENDMKEFITCISKALDLKEHLHKRTKELGVGIKRKLSFALSMLGNPHVALLDEPSTGMDPVGIQQMWKAIRVAFKNRERAAILTTHYMEEAEAVCDRVAILVSGKLRCIGTVQHLKSKFGRGYFLEMKLKEVPDIQQKERLQRRILRIFPNASCQKSFASVLAYKIPKEDVHSLAVSFSKLEEARHAFNVEEYSFSQATLEQVFMELVKEQEEEESHFGTLHGTISWERSQGERVLF